MIRVVAGIIEREDQRLLVTERRLGTHLAGAWEFPGGKVSPTEPPFAALQRELAEEIGITVYAARPLIGVHWRYPQQPPIWIDFWRVTNYTGSPIGREGQRLQWLPLTTIDPDKMPAANGSALRALGLPDHYAITPEPTNDTDAFLERAGTLVSSGQVRMLQLRAKTASTRTLTALAVRLQPVCAKYGALLLVNSAVSIAKSLDGVGVHLTADELHLCRHRPLGSRRRVGASCHNAIDLAQATAIGADFATLGPIHSTPSHPNASAIGWSTFQSLTANAQLPVYALGGLQPIDREQAWRHGGQGVAAIRSFWEEV